VNSPKNVKALAVAGLHNSSSNKTRTTAFAFLTMIAWTMSAFAQSAPTPAGSSEKGSSALSANELVKEVNNPVTSIWSLQFEFNNASLEGHAGRWEGWANNLYFQPVIPISLTRDWNLITRPVMTLYQSVPTPTPGGGTQKTTAFGDTILAQVLSPAHTEPWIFGVGPTWIFPTAGSTFTGQGKWQVGPAFGAGYITNEFMVAAFAQQWWSFAGDATRKDTSQMNILPLIYKYFDDGWSFGYSGNILIDWRARSQDVWTVPIGLSVGKIVQFGKLPVQIRLGGQYFVARPEGGPEWNIQLQVTPVIPKLISKTLFE
jgi:hypothetical protein